MKHTLLTVSLAAAAFAALVSAPTPSQAQQASPLTFNVGAVTEYRYRGISQSRFKPALQAGADYSNGPFYIGTWASTIQWIKDAGGQASVEIDLYGGLKGEIAKDLSYDVGVLSYQYPSNKLNPKAETFEIYGALTYGPVTAKYSQSTGNLFGFAGSSGSGYLDITATFDVGGISVAPHIGHQSVKGKGNGIFSYTDYALGLSKEVSGITWSATVYGTDAKATSYPSPSKQNLGKSSVVLGAKLNF